MKMFIQFALEILVAGVAIVMFIRVTKQNDEFFKMNLNDSFDEKVKFHL